MDIVEQVAISVGKEPLSDCPLHNTFVPGPSLHTQFVNKLDSQLYWGLYSLFILFFFFFYSLNLGEERVDCSPPGKRSNLRLCPAWRCPLAPKRALAAAHARATHAVTTAAILIALSPPMVPGGSLRRWQ